MGATHIHDLALIIDDLERSGRLTRVSSSVELKHDLAGLAATFEGEPRAVLFENVAGHAWPVLTGLYWSRDLLADVLRREESTLPQFIADCIRDWQQSPIDPVIVPTGPVLDVTETDVDLTRIPIPVHAVKDAGPYFDAGVVIARDPETGVRNASIQRFQVVAKDRLHVNIDAGRHLGLYLEKAKARGESLTFTLNCGVGPGLHFAASAPAEAAPADTDELGIASAFHGAPLELVKASNGTDDIVAHAMWALECEIIPGELADEGPFAEVTGYYATIEPRPVVHVRKIHRRANPVFQTILSGVEVWNSVGLLGEANILQLLQKQVPGVVDVYMSHGGGGFYHCIVQIAPTRQGWSKQAILAAFAAFPPLKMVTIVDDDVDLRSAQDVEWAMATRLNPKKDIVTIDESFGHGLNPSFPDYLGPKVGFDATKPYPATWAYERATYKPMTLEAVNMLQPEIVRRLQGGAIRMTAERGAKPSREEIEAFEAALARPQPIELTPVGAGTPMGTGVAADSRTADDRTADDRTADNRSDFDLTRPQPIDLNVRGVASPMAAPAAHDSTEDWITRPTPADLTPVVVNANNRTRRETGDVDPDAWIVQAPPADLTPIAVKPAATIQGGGTQTADDPDSWIIRPAAADLAPVPKHNPAAARVAQVEEPTPADADAWITRPTPVDLTPVDLTPVDLTPVTSGASPPDEPALPQNEPDKEADTDVWIARPAAIDLTPVSATSSPKTAEVAAEPVEVAAPVDAVEPPEPAEPSVPAAGATDKAEAALSADALFADALSADARSAGDDNLVRPAAAEFEPPHPVQPAQAVDLGAADQEATVSNMPSDLVDDARDAVVDTDSEAREVRVEEAGVETLEAAEMEQEEVAAAAAPDQEALAEKPPVESQPPAARAPSRPTASVEKPASVSPLRRFAKAPPKTKLPKSSVRSGGSFFEPSADGEGESTSGDSGRAAEVSAGKPKTLVAMPRTNRGELPRKIQPVGLPVSDKNEVVRPSGFFDSTPVPTKPVRKIARSIARAASSPRLRNVIKPPKPGGFFDED